MKTRNGFVSNSSSSSFVCDVCGTTESGWDASASDFDMETCCNGHTFCNDHAVAVPASTPQSLRESVKNQINSKTWKTAEDRKGDLEELENIDDEDLEDFIRDNYSDDGCPECECPVCSMTVLRDVDGFAYLKKKLGVTDDNILSELKADFKSYSEFRNHLFPKK